MEQVSVNLATKILLVDDARSVAQVMTSRLNSYGHEVVHAENGAQTVEIFPTTCPTLKPAVRRDGRLRRIYLQRDRC